MTQTEVYDIHQTASILHKNVRTIHRFMEHGKLKPVQRQPKILFNKADVDALASFKLVPTPNLSDIKQALSDKPQTLVDAINICLPGIRSTYESVAREISNPLALSLRDVFIALINALSSQEATDREDAEKWRKAQEQIEQIKNAGNNAPVDPDLAAHYATEKAKETIAAMTGTPFTDSDVEYFNEAQKAMAGVFKKYAKPNPSAIGA